MTKLELKRRERDLTQAQLSELSGVTTTTISGIECGRTDDLMMSTAFKLSKALGCTVDDIFCPKI